MKKIIISLVLCSSISLSALAETCPDPNNIKAGNLQGWLALNSTNDEPANLYQIAVFKKTINNFWLAEWTTEYPLPVDFHGRCYYESEIEVYLAKDVLKPITSSGYWKKNGDIDQCYSESTGSCPFG